MGTRGTAALALLLCIAGCDRAPRAAETTEQSARAEAAEADPLPATLPPGVDRAVALRGREPYYQACVMCHGEQGRGTQLGPPLPAGAGVDSIARVVAAGVPRGEAWTVAMPARGDGSFTDEQVRAVSAYAAALAR